MFLDNFRYLEYFNVNGQKSVVEEHMENRVKGEKKSI